MSTTISTLTEQPTNGMTTRNDKRAHVLNEILMTERSYVNDLKIVLNLFLRPLRDEGIIAKEHLTIIFLNFEPIYMLNTELLGKLESVIDPNQIDSTCQIGSAIIQIAHFLKLYSDYCSNYKEGLALVMDCSKTNPNFMKFLTDAQENPQCKGLTLMDYLIKPIQRICKYPLLFRELLSVTPPEHADYSAVCSTLKLFEEVTESANKISAEKENIIKVTNFNTNVQGFQGYDHFKDGRRAIRDEWLHIQTPTLGSSTGGGLSTGGGGVGVAPIGVTSLGPTGGSSASLTTSMSLSSLRHVYLFSDMVTITKLKNKRAKVEKVIFFAAIWNVSLLDTPDSDKGKFMFTIQSNDTDVEYDKSFTFYCLSPGIKTQWMNDFKTSKSEWESKKQKSNLDDVITILQSLANANANKSPKPIRKRSGTKKEKEKNLKKKDEKERRELVEAKRTRFKPSLSSPAISPSKVHPEERKQMNRRTSSTAVKGLLRFNRTKTHDGPPAPQPQRDSITECESSRSSKIIECENSHTTEEDESEITEQHFSPLGKTKSAKAKLKLSAEPPLVHSDSKTNITKQKSEGSRTRALRSLVSPRSYTEKATTNKDLTEFINYGNSQKIPLQTESLPELPMLSLSHSSTGTECDSTSTNEEQVSRPPSRNPPPLPPNLSDRIPLSVHPTTTLSVPLSVLHTAPSRGHSSSPSSPRSSENSSNQAQSHMMTTTGSQSLYLGAVNEPPTTPTTTTLPPIKSKPTPTPTPTLTPQTPATPIPIPIPTPTPPTPTQTQTQTPATPTPTLTLTPTPATPATPTIPTPPPPPPTPPTTLPRTTTTPKQITKTTISKDEMRPITRGAPRRREKTVLLSTQTVNEIMATQDKNIVSVEVVSQADFVVKQIAASRIASAQNHRDVLRSKRKNNENSVSPYCYACNTAIPSSITALHTLDRYYHPSCFCCKSCSIDLQFVPFFVGSNCELYCSSCFNCTQQSLTQSFQINV